MLMTTTKFRVSFNYSFYLLNSIYLNKELIHFIKTSIKSKVCIIAKKFISKYSCYEDQEKIADLRGIYTNMKCLCSGINYEPAA